MSAPRDGVTHIAGLVCQVGSLVRQRCGWCGAMLSDYDLALTAVSIPDPVPEGWTATVAMWELGCLVNIDGPVAQVVQPEAEGKLPAEACMALDPGATA